MEHYRLDVGEEFFDEMRLKAVESPGEVVMVIRRPGNKILLMTKEFYPRGVYRLPSGKCLRGEKPEETLRREIAEETGLPPFNPRRLETLHYMLGFSDRRADFLSYIYIVDEAPGTPESLDEDERISDFKDVEVGELHRTALQLSNLPQPWTDWGRFRSVPHYLVHRALCSAGGGPG